MAALRTATFQAVSLEVACPHCGAAQPNTSDGGSIWLPSEVTVNQGNRVCNDCDEPYKLLSQKTAEVCS